MKLSTLAKALALVSITVAGAANAAPVPVLSYNGSDYYLTTNTANTWTAGEADAVAMGGHLVTINDAAEETALRTAFGGTSLFWIGFTDQAVEGTFVWISGEAVTYTHWAAGEPNQAGNEDYTVVNWNTTNGAWNDLANSNSARGIIEVRQAVPEPGSLALAGLALLGLGASRRRKA